MDSSTKTQTLRFDPAEIRRALRLFLPRGQVTELRALQATTHWDRWPQTLTGYFDDAEMLIEALPRITSAKGIYFIPNPIEPALLARAMNRVRKAEKGESTSDQHIVVRRWLLVDVDAQRPTGISATIKEQQAALARASAICNWLHEQGWPEPIRADSGNGAHLNYRLDLPACDDGIVQRCIEALGEKFDDEQVKVDVSVFNPARIWKLYGTMSCKGDDTPERPHRMARVLSAPEEVVVVDRSLLEALAAEASYPANHDTNGYVQSNGQGFDIDTFITRHGLELDGPHTYQDGRRWTFMRSPLCEHHGDGPFLIQFSSGALSAGCHHNSCSWTWHDLRVRFEGRKGPRGVDKTSREMGKHKVSSTSSVSAPVLEEYIPFPVDTLPPVVTEYVAAAADAIGCDPSFIALPLLACLARAIGNKRVIRLKRTWSEPSIIWGAIVGKSGTHKTPALQAATSYLQRKQSDAIAQYDDALAKYEEERAVYEREYAAWKRSRKSGPTEPPPWPPALPVCTRYVTTDATMEAIASLLVSKSDGLLVVRDELAGWFGGIAEYKGGKGSDLGHWLACWSGVPLIVDRKTGAKKMIHVPRASVSIVGGIQPGVLRTAIGREHMQDGLCARLLLAMPDPRPVRWSDAIVDPPTEAAMRSFFDRLLSLEPAADEDGNPAPFPLPLTPEAQEVWVAYYNRHRAELAELDDDLAAAWSKLEAYTARFALIFQLSSRAAGDGDAEDIDQLSVQAAIRLSDWFGGEARRVYGVLAETDEEREARDLLALIRRKGGRMTTAELMRCSRRYTTAEAAEWALDRLVKAQSGRWESLPTGPKGGKPSRAFRTVDTADVDHTR